MKNILKKTITLLITGACLLTVGFAENSKLETAKNEGKLLIADLGSALKNISSSIESEVSKGVSKTRIKLAENLLGTWTFSNSTASTTFVFNNDETMTITQKGILKSRSWEGTFNALGSSIAFTVSGGDNNDETWNLKYSIDEDTTKMTITSDDLPDDYNKFDFSKSAIFTKK